MNIFGSKEPPTRGDPVFGRISYENGIWTFIPKGEPGEFMINIEADGIGPSQIQRDFFLTLRKDLPSWIEKARIFVQSHMSGKNDLSKLGIYSVNIGPDADCARRRFTLELTDGKANEIHGILFQGGDPQQYYCDD